MQLARLRLDPTVAPLLLHSLNGWVAVRCRPNIVQVFETKTLRQVCRRRSAYVQDVAPRAFGSVDPLTLDHYAGSALEAARAKCQLDWRTQRCINNIYAVDLALRWRPLVKDL